MYRYLSPSPFDLFFCSSSLGGIWAVSMLIGPLMGGGKCDLAHEPLLSDFPKGSHKAKTPAGDGQSGSTSL